MALTLDQTFAGWCYGICMVLALSYPMLACATAAIARDTSAAVALAAVGFAAPGAGFATTVCFLQLATVLHASAASQILTQLS